MQSYLSQMSGRCPPKCNRLGHISLPSVPTKCNGEAISGTGRFEGVSGKMTWIDKSGFGEGQGTFNLK